MQVKLIADFPAEERFADQSKVLCAVSMNTDNNTMSFLFDAGYVQWLAQQPQTVVASRLAGMSSMLMNTFAANISRTSPHNSEQMMAEILENLPQAFAEVVDPTSHDFNN